MPTTDTNFYEGHRERLRAKFMDGKITEVEFVELMLTFVIPRRDVRPISRALMQRYRGMLNITTAPISELTQFPGIGRRTAEYLKCLGHATMLQYMEILRTEPVFKRYDALMNYCKMLVTNKMHEEVHIMYLDANCRMITTDLHTKGTLNESQVYVRDIAARAYGLNAQFVIMIHNHPGGTRTFSADDTQITRDLDRVLSAMNITLHDHFLIVDGIVIAARDAGVLPPLPKK